MPVLSSYRKETSHLICTANQLAGFDMRVTLVFNGLIERKLKTFGMTHETISFIVNRMVNLFILTTY